LAPRSEAVIHQLREEVRHLRDQVESLTRQRDEHQDEPVKFDYALAIQALNEAARLIEAHYLPAAVSGGA
jgi:hypothetical protein